MPRGVCFEAGLRYGYVIRTHRQAHKLERSVGAAGNGCRYFGCRICGDDFGPGNSSPRRVGYGSSNMRYQFLRAKRETAEKKSEHQYPLNAFAHVPFSSLNATNDCDVAPVLCGLDRYQRPKYKAIVTVVSITIFTRTT